MYRLVHALESLARACGAGFRYGSTAREVVTRAGRVVGVRLEDGEMLAADAVIANVDAAAIADGLLGPDAAAALQASGSCARSLSALTWTMLGEARGFPLLHHTVFFSPDYEAEFDSLVQRGQLPAAPTVYVCAQDRTGDTPPAPGRERLLCLINAPAIGDRHDFPAAEIEACESRTFGTLRRCGLQVQWDPGAARVTTPADFERLFPRTGGALYGPASHHWNAAFKRQGARTSIPGLYLAGGSTHPGAGVPMALLSGRQATAALLADRASIRRSSRVAMHGGTSMR
jgi:1-hydroxycarotenoid 3,4-desaturase